MKALPLVALVCLGCSAICPTVIVSGVAMQTCFRNVQACRYTEYANGEKEWVAASFDPRAAVRTRIFQGIRGNITGRDISWNPSERSMCWEAIGRELVNE